MAEITQERILKALETVLDPDLGTSIVAMGMIKDMKIEGVKVGFTCELTTPACPVKEQIEKDIRARIAQHIPEIQALELNMTGKVRGHQIPSNDTAENLLPQVKNLILIGSGKGGVGKSTCTLNLALALKSLGASVAVLDADIYGPSIPIFSGLREKPKLAGENKIRPMEAFGIEIMSMGFLVDPNQAMIWRGAILNGIMVQFLRDVVWSERDYLLVDLPSGSSEVQLALVQNCAATGAVLVSTPQYASIANVIRGKAMFEQMRVPVLGLIENMAGGVFGSDGAEKAAAELQVPFLGRIPLAAAVSEGSDSGIPIVLSQPQSDAGRAFLSAAEKLAARISVRNFGGEAPRRLSEAVDPTEPVVV